MLGCRGGFSSHIVAALVASALMISSSTSFKPRHRAFQGRPTPINKSMSSNTASSSPSSSAEGGGSGGGGGSGSEYDRAEFSLYRCDNFEECREAVLKESMEIVYRAAAAEQVILVWQQKPKRVLLLTKPIEFAPELMSEVARSASMLARNYGMTVCVEADVHRRLHDLIDAHERGGGSNEPSNSPGGSSALSSGSNEAVGIGRGYQLLGGGLDPDSAFPPRDSLELFAPPADGSRFFSADAEAEAVLIAAEAQQQQPPVDLVVTLGGDGLLMHANSVFQAAAPPILSLSGGSLGFLAPFEMDDMEAALARGLQYVGGPRWNPTDKFGGGMDLGMLMSLRMRLTCSFVDEEEGEGVEEEEGDIGDYDNYGAERKSDGDEAAEIEAMKRRAMEAAAEAAEAAAAEAGGTEEEGAGAAAAWQLQWRQEQRELQERRERRDQRRRRDGKPDSWTVLNEVVIGRGSSLALTRLEVYVNGAYLTTMQADGVIVATPTGSTAYSMSAAGSMVHPSVPAILLTPICPHSLSCRPMILPDSAEVRVRNSPEARADSWVTFDGKHQHVLKRGQTLRIGMSNNPLPTVNKVDDTADWFDGIASAFHFNTRPMQRSLSPPPAPKQRSK